MVSIEKIRRAYKIEKSGFVLDEKLHTYYIETEAEFLKGIENLCNSIGENNIISIQFFDGERQEIDGCIITYKE